MYQKQPSEKAVWDMGLINPHGLCFKIRKKKICCSKLLFGCVKGVIFPTSEFTHIFRSQKEILATEQTY